MTSVSICRQIRDQCVHLLVTRYRDSILAECPAMVRHHDTEKLSLMFGLMDRGTDLCNSGSLNGSGSGSGSGSGVEPMLRVVEDHIKSAGLDAMLANADSITQVGTGERKSDDAVRAGAELVMCHGIEGEVMY